MNKLFKIVEKIKTKYKTFDKQAVKLTCIVTALMIAVCMLYGLHIKEFMQTYRNLVDDFIVYQTGQEGIGISNEFRVNCSVIEYVSKSVSKLRTTRFIEAIDEIMGNAANASGFESVVYIDTKGKVYFSDGTVSKDIDTSDIISGCDISKGASVFNNSKSFMCKNGGLGIIAPIRNDNVVEGFVCATVPYEELVGDDLKLNSIPHETVILDENGRVVALVNNDKTVKVAANDWYFFDELQATMPAEEFAELTTQFNERVSSQSMGRAYADTKEKRILLVYYPIESTNGWTVMSCYSEDSIRAVLKRIERDALIVFAVIVMLMIIAATLIIRYAGSEKRKIVALEYLDGLTGAYNRNAFVKKAGEMLKEKKNLPYYMICFDVVNFRIINETYGHERADVIIKETAKACKESFGHDEVFGRLTADVFVAITVDDGEEDERIEFIEQYVEKAARGVYINHPIKVKRGRYQITDVNESVNSMIDKANIARKYVNLNAGDLTCEYTSALMNEAKKTEEIESQMENALKSGEFKPYLQAKFNMEKKHVSGAEALVRWIKDDGSVVPPGDFIPLFERNGFVEKIDFYMLEEVCKYIRRMIDENRKVYKVSVNQSRYLMNDPEYVNKVREILLKYQIPVGLIELELTETVFFHEKDRMIKMMNELKDMNVDLSIDDFGSGYSSFNILKDVPFDVLKIDREFLSDSVHTEKGKLILQKIVDMAHGLGMSVICEGVETQEQIDLLLSIDCHYAQGFYYARPVSIEEFIENYNSFPASLGDVGS